MYILQYKIRGDNPDFSVYLTGSSRGRRIENIQSLQDSENITIPFLHKKYKNNF